MESYLWNLEDKWKLSTKESVAFFVCTCSLVIGICIVVAFITRRATTRRNGLVGPGPAHDIEWPEPKLLSLNSNCVKKVLTRTVRWSGPRKWEKKRSGSHTERVSQLLVAAGQLIGESVRWQSHNSDSPVWQRPILMGEKCELRRFSGLILYDERGRPVHHVDNDQFIFDQECCCDVYFDILAKVLYRKMGFILESSSKAFENIPVLHPPISSLDGYFENDTYCPMYQLRRQS